MNKEINYDEIYAELSAIDCSKYVQTVVGKRGLKLRYLSWSHCWHLLKSRYPMAEAIVYESPKGLNYWEDGRTGYVKCGVRIGDREEIEYLPIMDYSNKSIPLDKITSFDVNTSIKRCMTKACALWGLGLNVYANEDLPLGYLDGTLDKIDNTTTVEDLQQIWNDCKDLQQDSKFVNAIKTKKKQLLEQAKDDIINA